MVPIGNNLLLVISKVEQSIAILARPKAGGRVRCPPFPLFAMPKSAPMNSDLKSEKILANIVDRIFDCVVFGF
jgi:hypothetical protein